MKLFRRAGFASLCILSVLLLAEVALLGLKAYSKVWLTTASLPAALTPANPLVLEGLSWDPMVYAGAEKLRPVAAIVRERCPRATALETVACMSDLLAERFPHGEPSIELFHRDYDPAAAFHMHLAGSPGHCVSRSGLLAAALLSVGFPARVVQMLDFSRDRQDPRSGHTALEVWDEGGGWIFFDPSYGGSLRTKEGARSTAALLVAGGDVTWVQMGKVPASVVPGNADGAKAYAGTLTQERSGHIIYPDPWLYTRVGKKRVMDPFIGRFVVVGGRSLRLAEGHWLLHGAIAATCLGIFASGVGLIMRAWLSIKRPRRADSAVLAARTSLSDLDR